MNRNQPSRYIPEGLQSHGERASLPPVESGPGGDAVRPEPAAGDLSFLGGLEGMLSILIRGGKNHLDPIKGYASLIQDDANEGSNARRWADKIVRNVQKMEDHYDSLDMFRLGGAIGVTDVSWHRMVSEVMDRFAAVNVKGVPIEITTDARGSFRQHRELLKRVLVHLVVNAYESIAETGKLTLSVSEQPPSENGRRRFALRIADTGCGIDGARMDQIWKPFYTTKRDRLGLGLPYVVAAASIMNFETEVVSTVGHGTTVGLVLSEEGG